MKTKQTLTVLLVFSISANIFIYLTAFSPAVEINGYTAAATVSEETANTDINTYANEYGGTAGGIVSGSVFNEIFSDPNSNAVAYRLAKDGNGQIYIVLEGANVVEENGEIKSATITGSNLFRANNWCPPNCVSITRE